MWNKPTVKQLEKIPALYSNDETPIEDTKIRMHFFIGGTDIFISEFDGNDTFYGFTVLNGDLMNAEWGYSSFQELKSIKSGFVQLDRDIHWTVKKASEVELIRKAQGW